MRRGGKGNVYGRGVREAAGCVRLGSVVRNEWRAAERYVSEVECVGSREVCE